MDTGSRRSESGSDGMPTHTETVRFRRDYNALTPEQREKFKGAVRRFVADLRGEQGFRKGLRVKSVKGTRNVFELTWAPDRRATFEYGDETVAGEQHVIWRRVGTHDILQKP